MAHVANLTEIVMRGLRRDVLTATPIGNLWCGDRTESALRTLTANLPVRMWSVSLDEHGKWHAYIMLRNGTSFHGTTVDHDSALRVAIGELLVAKVEV